MQNPLIPSRLAIPAALPPAYELVLAAGEGAHDTACRIAPERGAGAFVWAPHAHVLDFAVVLEPDEPLRTARRAFIAGMGALADAVAAYCPPEKPVAILWPDTLVFNVARLGGGRLGIPDGCGEDDVPDWLVVSAQLLASKADFGDPGLTPDSTSLEEEGFDPDEFTALAESFARHLMLAFDTWNERGFKAVAEGFLARLPEAAPGERRAIDESGDLLARAQGSAAAPTRTRLAPALAEPAWFDPATGMVRL